MLNNTAINLHPVQAELDRTLLDTQLKRFSRFLLVNLGLHKSSINNMRKLARRVVNQIGTLIPSHEEVQDFIADMHEHGYSFWHIVNTSLAVERYMEFIGNPIKLGRPRKPKRTVKETLSEAEVAVILAACKNAREKAILTIMAYSGIRVAELCNLKAQDIDVAGGMINVIQGKGCKDRCIPVSGECIRIVIEYLAAYPRSDSDHLFTTVRKNTRYTEWAARRLVKKVVKRTMIKKNVHPHLFRHSLATNMLMRGAGLMTIKQQLGHSDIQTTMIYLNPKTTRLAADYQAYAPSYI